MRKKFSFLFFLMLIILINGCYYASLDNNESIIIADNPTKSLLFLENEYGYGESTRFIIKTNNNGVINIKEGKMYKEDFSYKNIMENPDAILLSNINGELFYKNINGLQGIKYLNENDLITDISYNYAQNGFGEVIKQIGTLNYINLFNNGENKIISNVLNENILYVENSINSIEDKKNIEVIKKQICIYKQNNEVYLLKKVNTKNINVDSNEENIVESEQNIKLIDVDNIKKIILIDNKEYSYTLILRNNNEIISINNNDVSINKIKIFSNILTYNRADKYIYIIENNKIILLDCELNVIYEREFQKQIIGSSWFKERELSHIKIALLNNENEIIIERIDLPKE